MERARDMERVRDMAPRSDMRRDMYPFERDRGGGRDGGRGGGRRRDQPKIIHIEQVTENHTKDSFTITW